jgi:mRNA-degrading endonuclease RelE of RelBE toxin-antitoxin system
MNISYSKSSLKYLSKTEIKIRANIVSAIDQLPEAGDTKKMRGTTIEDLYRLRIGKYRVLFIWRSTSIKILEIDTRGDIYSRSR